MRDSVTATKRPRRTRRTPDAPPALHHRETDPIPLDTADPNRHLLPRRGDVMRVVHLSNAMASTSRAFKARFFLLFQRSQPKRAATTSRGRFKHARDPGRSPRTSWQCSWVMWRVVFHVFSVCRCMFYRRILLGLRP